MVAHGKYSGLGSEGPVIVAIQDFKGIPQSVPNECFLRGKNDFGRAQTLQFGEKRGVCVQFRGQKFAGGQIHEGKAEKFCIRANGRQEIIFLAVSMRSSKWVPGERI